MLNFDPYHNQSGGGVKRKSNFFFGQAPDTYFGDGGLP
jgi:hypothetical protein